jgi:hypothetical protein
MILIIQGNNQIGFRFCKGVDLYSNLRWSVVDSIGKKWSYPDKSFFLTGRLEIIT